jgi:nucleoside-diphosphate-sugar epimerase
MKKILVTGASGFIGKNITKKLLENNSVDVYCRELKKDDPSWIKDNHIDQDILVSSYKDTAYDYVINCIACADTSSKDWNKLYEANCKTIIALMNNINFKNFIQFSSFSIFSKNSIKAGSADPNNLYGLSKLVSEKLLEMHANPENKFIVLRMPIVIGKSKKQDDVVSYLYKSLVKNEKIDIFNDGKFLRNIIHVNEIAAYLNEIIIYSKFTENYTAINLNSRNLISVYNIYSHMKKKLKSESKLKLINKKSSNDFDSLILNNYSEEGMHHFKSCEESINYFIEEMKMPF